MRPTYSLAVMCAVSVCVSLACGEVTSPPAGQLDQVTVSSDAGPAVEVVDSTELDSLADSGPDVATQQPDVGNQRQPDVGDTALRQDDVMDVASVDAGQDTSPLDVEDGWVAQDTVAQDTVAQDTVAQDTVAQDTVAQDAQVAGGLWLISIGAAKPAGGTPLYRIDVTTGAGKTHCTINTSDSYPSSTFGRDGKLYGSNNTKDRLDIIDPCSCKVQPVGPFGYTFIPGITSNQGTGLFGIENTVDALLTINPLTGGAKKVGAFGVNFGNGGATWSDSLGAVYAIDATSDALYTLDPLTGKATLKVKLNKNFGTVGMELHPANGVIYACTSDAILYTVDPASGQVSAVGKLPHVASCNNLAAPWTAVSCLDTP